MMSGGPVPAPPLLRAVVVMDYQNVHLTGHELFVANSELDKHESLVDPLLYGQQVLRVRNARQRPGYASAMLQRVLVYRGQHTEEHNPEMYAYGLAEKAQWERDRRVRVQLRPLKYYYEYGADNRPLVDVHGRKIYSRAQEKGVDVLVALALVREARLSDVDLVILASTDSDLAPALDEAHSLHAAKVETVSWWSPSRRNQQLRAEHASLWNTRLNEQDFDRVRDRTDYHRG